MEREELISAIEEALDNHELKQDDNETKVWQVTETLFIITAFIYVMYMVTNNFVIMEVDEEQYTLVQLVIYELGIEKKPLLLMEQYTKIYSVFAGASSLIIMFLYLVVNVICDIWESPGGSEKSHKRIMLYLGIGEVIIMLIQLLK